MAQQYRVTRKRIVRSKTTHPDYDGRHDREPGVNEDLDGEVFEAGDVFEPTEDEIRAFSDRLEPVGDSGN